MTERTWIKIHSGLTNDPTHRERMGIRVWLFMWLVDHAEWDTGVVYNYTDKWAGEEMQVSSRTIERQRQDLEGQDYIFCHAGFQCQHIRIMRWRNPKLVNPYQINVPGLPDTCAELRTHGTQSCVPIPTANCVPLHIDHNISESITQSVVVDGSGWEWVYQMYLDVFKEAVNSGEHDALRNLAQAYTQADVKEAMAITQSANSRRRIARKVFYMRGILQDWAKNGKDAPTQPAPLQRAPSLESLGYKVVR